MLYTNDLTINQLIANIIREEPASETVNSIIKSFQENRSPYEITEEELLQLKGVGPIKARSIVAALKLSQLISLKKIIGSIVAVNNPREVANLLMEDMRYLDREQFRILMLTTKNTIIGCETISIGGLNSSIVHPREVFKIALKKSAFFLILLHNHPSGDPKPSPQDIAITVRLIEVGKIMGIEVLDHIVFGDGTYVSMKESSLI